MAPLKKSVVNKNSAQTTSSNGVKKTSQKKTAGAASKKNTAPDIKKMSASDKKSKIKTAKKTSRVKRNAPASGQTSSKAASAASKSSAASKQTSKAKTAGQKASAGSSAKKASIGGNQARKTAAAAAKTSAAPKKTSLAPADAKASANKASAKKASAKKEFAKKASDKKESAKKSSVKKASAENTSTKKASAKKASAKKASAEKASAKKASPKEQEEAETDVKVISVRIPIEEGAGEGAKTEEASTSGLAVDQMEESPATPRDFNLEQFISQKLQPSAAMSKVVSGSRDSSLADLIKFNAAMAHSFYQVSEEDSLETILYILQAEEDVKKLAASPGAAAAYREVVLYRDLLLLGDLASISQQKLPLKWIQQAGSLSGPAQTALMTSLLGLAIKLTGTTPSGLPDQLPGGKLQGKAKREISSYLTIIQDIADAMAEANHGYKTAESASLGRMHADINKIVGDF